MTNTKTNEETMHPYELGDSQLTREYMNAYVTADTERYLIGLGSLDGDELLQCNYNTFAGNYSARVDRTYFQYGGCLDSKLL